MHNVIPLDSPTGADGEARRAANNGAQRQPFVLPEVIEEGGRNDALARYAGQLRHAGLDEPQIAERLLATNAERCRPPLDETEVRGIAASIATYPTKGDGRVVVDLTGCDDEASARLIYRHLLEGNDPPHLYRLGRELVRVVRDHDRLIIDRLDATNLGGHITQRMRFVKASKTTGGKPVGHELRSNVPKKILAWPNWLRLPELDRIIRVPAVTRSGQILMADGYVPEVKAYVDLGGLVLTEVPEEPTCEQVQIAISWIDELLADFPFDGPASRANAIALAILPLVRMLIDGPTPLNLVSAPGPRAGKTLLICTLMILALGDPQPPMSEARDDDEWRKRIFAALLGSPAYVFIDNVSRKLDTPSLCVALTSTTFEERVLGESRTASAVNDAVWVATGNNPRLSDEVAARSVLIRLVPQVEHPELRSNFRHELPRWAKEQRPNLLCSLLVLVRNWFARGCPPCSRAPRKGGFEAYRNVLGGILEAAGIEGFLANDGALREQSTGEEGQFLRDLVPAWWAKYRTSRVRAGELARLAREANIGFPGDELPADAPDFGNDALKRATALGKLLSRSIDKVFAGLMIVSGGRDSSTKTNTYLLQEV